jgi:hypothetical protein
MTVDGLLDSLTGCIVLVSHLIRYEPQQMVVQWGLGPYSRGWNGDKFAAILLKPFHARISTVRLCIAVLQNDLFLPGHLSRSAW